jgi:hypothetical protein
MVGRPSRPGSGSAGGAEFSVSRVVHCHVTDHVAAGMMGTDHVTT